MEAPAHWNPAMTDWRKLLAELVAMVERADWSDTAALQDAREALSRPEPEPPTRQELYQLAEAYCISRPGWLTTQRAVAYARDVLSRWGER